MSEFDQDEFANEFMRHMDRIYDSHDKKNQEFKRLLCEPSQRVPEVGDRVIIAAGLIGRGHDWVRLEAKVIEVGETSVRVCFLGRDFRGEPDIVWVHPVLITDVLKSKIQSPRKNFTLPSNNSSS